MGYQTIIKRIFLSDQYWKLFFNTHSYNLAKFLLSILHPLSRDQFRVKKSVSPNALLQTVQLKVLIHSAIFNITPVIMNTSVDKTIKLICNKYLINNATFH